MALGTSQIGNIGDRPAGQQVAAVKGPPIHFIIQDSFKRLENEIHELSELINNLENPDYPDHKPPREEKEKAGRQSWHETIKTIPDRVNTYSELINNLTGLLKQMVL